MSSEAHSRIGPGIGVVLLLFNLTMASRTLAENSRVTFAREHIASA
jgi:hypothetical protein